MNIGSLLVTRSGRRRLGFMLVVLAGVLVGVATWLRGGGGGPGTRLIDVVALLSLVAGAVIATRADEPALTAGVPAARRRALLALAGGLFLLLLGCILLQAADEASRLVRALLAGAAVAGSGALLVGLLSLGWVYGGSYAADRIERMDDER